MKAQAYALAVVLWFGTGCHGKPPVVVSTSSAAVGGTIVGVVNGTADRLARRQVTLVNIDTGQRYETTTGENGGYSLRVPPGTYRVEIALRDDEKLADPATMLLKNTDSTSTPEINVGR